MKMRIALVVVGLSLTLAASPAVAQGLYNNGPVNGNFDAWTINFAFAVTDSIQVNGTVTGLDFYAWLTPGDVVSNVQVQIGSSPFGSNDFNGFVSITQSSCQPNNFGFNVCLESGNFSGPALSGNAWVTLQNASAPSGDPVYWDANSGAGCTSPGCPSQAEQNQVGSIPSESFTILGNSSTTTSSTGTTPEPGSILLLGSGMIGLAGFLRRKLF